MSGVNKLAGSLVGHYSGPVLVVGGAPSVPAELARLRAAGFDLDSCVIVSANEHAVHAGLAPHFAVVNDDVHSQLGVHQEPRMRRLMPYTSLLSRHWWADFRTPQLMACNSGLKALLYAALLGGNPIIAIGFDHYRSSELYFHDVDTGGKSNPNQSRSMPHFTQQVARVKAALEGVPVRPVSGPLTQVWPAWDPQEQFLQRELCALERDAQSEAQDTHYICSTDAAASFEGALMPDGAIFAVTAREAVELTFNSVFVDATKWDLSDKAGARLKYMEQQRIEQARLFGLIGKVRNSPRSVRRGIEDADLIRIIKWTENGDSPEIIAGRTCLPKQQIQYMVNAMGVSHEAGQGVGRDAAAVQQPCDGAAPDRDSSGAFLL